jgi:ParB family chromosome partitioning protein
MAAKIRDIAIKDIEAGERLREADGAWIGTLMDSIRDNGLLQPLIVRPIRRVGKRPFELLAGMHRLAACQSLNWSTVPCLVLEVDNQQALLAQIDENIARHELNILDRAVALVERQAIYEALHPETRAGVAGAMAKHGSANEKISFAEDAAEKTGLSPRAIQMATKLVKGLRPETRARLAGTWPRPP